MRSPSSSSTMIDNTIIIGYKDEDSFSVDPLKISNVLVSGTTGSGKTAFVQSMITQVAELYSNPEKIKAIIIDSRGMEYSYLVKSPYLMTQFIMEPRNASGCVAWLTAEAQRRISKEIDESKWYDIFVVLDDYGEIAYNNSRIDEEVMALLRLTRIARIHCIFVTSTPSSRVFSTDVMANIPYRVSFRTTSKNVSRMVIGDAGAETLRVPGEMIVVSPNRTLRLDSYYLDYDQLIEKEKELTNKFSEFTGQSVLSIDDIISYDSSWMSEFPSDYSIGNDRDEYFAEVGYFIIEKQKASIGAIQRAFRIGFNRAARLMDQLSDAGVIGPEEGMSGREILMDREEFDEYLACGPDC